MPGLSQGLSIPLPAGQQESQSCNSRRILRHLRLPPQIRHSPAEPAPQNPATTASQTQADLPLTGTTECPEAALVCLRSDVLQEAQSRYSTVVTPINGPFIGRISGIIVSLRAIVQSPLVGYGSWTVNKELANELCEEITERGAKTKGDIGFSRLGSGSGFQSHSQIIQSRVEGGLLGAVFFLLYGYRLLQSMIWCTLKRPLDVFSPIFVYTVVMGIWDYFMSPFLGFGRMQIALTVGVLVILMVEKQGKVIPAPPTATGAEAPKQAPRSLKGARSNSFPST